MGVTRWCCVSNLLLVALLAQVPKHREIRSESSPLPDMNVFIIASS
jgi:hypothetical protein